MGGGTLSFAIDWWLWVCIFLGDKKTEKIGGYGFKTKFSLLLLLLLLWSESRGLLKGAIW
jgi:hypothetical protein